MCETLGHKLGLVGSGMLSQRRVQTALVLEPRRSHEPALSQSFAALTFGPWCSVTWQQEHFKRQQLSLHSRFGGH